MFINVGAIAGLSIDGLDQGKPVCMDYRSGTPQIQPGERVIATVGFDATDDATSGARVVLEAFDDLDLVVIEP